jgi:8-oxo-dGTP pyrophosphatase MutT (NUDIX family)
MLLSEIEGYEKKWPLFAKEQEDLIHLFKTFFIEHKEHIYERSNQEGHITASGFIISSDYSSLLMLHHLKLQKWLQLGGHADGHTISHEVAYRECEEESGLTSLTFFSDAPYVFDLDRHQIPARKGEKEHFHYDIRYLFIADKKEPLKNSEESLELKWIPLKEVLLYNDESSISRPLRKIYACTGGA